MASKKRKKVSQLKPVTRSLRKLRAEGWFADIAERKIGLFSSDYLGIVDIVAFVPDEHGLGRADLLLVQATSRGNIRARERKILETDVGRELLQLGVWIEVWGWDPYREDVKIIDVSASTSGSRDPSSGDGSDPAC